VIGASEDLYDRIARIDARTDESLISPARQMLDDLVQAF
jgi:hypothetical protein